MSFWSRLKNIISGKANKVLDNMENPVEQIDVAINQTSEALAKAKRSSASFIGSVSSKEREIDELKNYIKEYEDAIRKALSNDDKEVAKKFLSKVKDLQVQLAEKEKSYLIIKQSADKAKETIEQLEDKLRELTTSRQELSARYNTAKANAQVHEIVSGLSKDCNISLSDIESKIQEMEDYANGLNELSPKDTDAELHKYMSDTSSYDIEAELDKYR